MLFRRPVRRRETECFVLETDRPRQSHHRRRHWLEEILLRRSRLHHRPLGDRHWRTLLPLRRLKFESGDF